MHITLKENFFFIQLEDIRNKPLLVIEKLYQFIGVDDAFIPDEVYDKKNPAYVPKSQWINNIAKDFPHFMNKVGLVPLLNLLRMWKVHNLVFRLNERKDLNIPKLSASERYSLYLKFEKDIIQLEKLLDLDLSNWKELPPS